MFPLRDENPSRSVPVFTRALIVINAAAFVYELTRGPELKSFVFAWGMVPARVTLALRYGEEPVVGPALTFISSMFLHGEWLHLIDNI